VGGDPGCGHIPVWSNSVGGGIGMTKTGCWLAAPDIVFIELAADMGYDMLVLDAEHGTLDLKDQDRLIPFARRCGLDVFVKVEGPRAEPIQQALDFGANGVVVPHIGTAEHARHVCGASKYPPLGTRSYAGARTVRYAAPADDYFDDENRKTACFPMIETAQALADVEAILALPAVDGVFVGPSDLSLDRGRGRYRFGPADEADIAAIADAAHRAGKPWIMPAWTMAERAFAERRKAYSNIVVEQQSAMATGLKLAIDHG
ncbi:MAG: aldolase/citrate lyase family protein, partial [Caulobacterales bacterium]|nr:aldolase/citrate lyase family protein [Caulobacterales bacterium]